MRPLDGAPADTRRVGERWQTHLPSGSQIHMILIEHPDELPRIDAETGFQLAVGQPGGLRAVPEAHHRLEPFPGAVECGVDAARLAHPRRRPAEPPPRPAARPAQPEPPPPAPSPRCGNGRPRLRPRARPPRAA